MIKITEISEQQINAALQALNNEIESLRSQSKMTDSKQVNSDWDATSGPAQILNKPHLAPVATSGSYNDLKDRPPNIGGSFTQVNSDWAETRGVAAILNKPNLATVATTGNYNDLINKPTIPTHTSQLTNNSDFTTKSYVDNTVNALENQLATVATTGNYNDLINKPTIPTHTSQLTNNSDFTTKSYVDNTVNALENQLATVATTGDYNDLNNKPTIPEVTYSLNEHKIGKWVDDSDLYEKTIVLNVPDNGSYEFSIGVSDLKNLVHFTGIFYQGSMSNPQWCMHIPYTFIDTSNGKFLNIYVYYDPPVKSFQCSFVGTYSPHYYNGEAYITFRYTKK